MTPLATNVLRTKRLGWRTQRVLLDQRALVRAALLGVLLAVVLGSFWLRPLMLKNETLEQMLLQAQAQSLLVERATQRDGSVDMRWLNQLMQQLPATQVSLTNTQAADQVLVSLGAVASAERVQLEAVTVNRPELSSTQQLDLAFYVTEFDLTVSGRYSDVRRFMARLLSQHAELGIERWSIVRQTAPNNGARAELRLLHVRRHADAN